MNNDTCVRWIAILLLLMVPLAPAAAGAEASLPPREGLVVLLPGAERSLVPRALESAGSVVTAGAASATVVQAADPRFLDPVRQSLIPSRIERAASGALALCPEERGFTQLLDQARNALDFLKRDQAEEMLARARDLVACQAQQLSSRDIARYHFLTGALAVSRGRDGSAAFETALAFQPDMPDPTDYPDEVALAFRRARSQLAQRPQVPVRFAADLAGLQLRIDGVPVAGVTSSLPATRHLLQLVNARDETVDSTILVLEPSPDAVPVDLPPVKMRPPPEKVVIDRLVTEASQGLLSAAISDALTTLLKSARLPWLLLILPGNAVQAPRAVIIGSDGRLSSERLEPRLEQKRAGAAWAIAGLGACAGVGAGVYGYAAYRIVIAEDFPDGGPEGRTLARIGDGAGLAGVTCLGGAAIVGGLKWWMSRSGHEARRGQNTTPAPPERHP